MDFSGEIHIVSWKMLGQTLAVKTCQWADCCPVAQQEMTAASTPVKPSVNELFYMPKHIRRFWEVISDISHPREEWVIPQLFIVQCPALQVLYSVSSITDFWCRGRWKEISMNNSPPQKLNSIKERNSFPAPQVKQRKAIINLLRPWDWSCPQSLSCILLSKHVQL